jgi:LacI family transcriptional regulator
VHNTSYQRRIDDEGCEVQSKKGRRVWRGPTIADIARASNLGTATVDRALNGRDSVRDLTRKKVLDALERLGRKTEAKAASAHRRIAFVTDSGVSFNDTLQQAVESYCALHLEIDCPYHAVKTADVVPIKFAQLLERAAEGSDGVIVVAREDLTINRAIRAIAARRTPIVCLTTDLPNSGRTAYIGSDQANAGATAAYIMGKTVSERAGRVLLAYSAPYRAQEEREIGFRRVLRAEFAHLDVDERVNSNDDTDRVYANVRRYIADHGAPVGVYNVSAGNVGIGRALEAEGLGGKVVFIGHELNPNSRMLLESGLMHFAIGHDVDREVDLAIDYIRAVLDKRPAPPPPPARVRVFTKFNCY